MEKLGLYLLIHGGVSFFTRLIDTKYERVQRSRILGRLSSFIDRNGRSELFKNYLMPVIIAHLGSYGSLHVQMRLIEDICKRYRQVFFDTSGTNPYFTKKAIQVVGASRIIFGSDAVYNCMLHNVLFNYAAVKSSTR